jgi:hypothetical protein
LPRIDVGDEAAAFVHTGRPAAASARRTCAARNAAGIGRDWLAIDRRAGFVRAATGSEAPHQHDTRQATGATLGAR